MHTGSHNSTRRLGLYRNESCVLRRQNQGSGSTEARPRAAPTRRTQSRALSRRPSSAPGEIGARGHAGLLAELTLPRPAPILTISTLVRNTCSDATHPHEATAGAVQGQSFGNQQWHWPFGNHRLPHGQPKGATCSPGKTYFTRSFPGQNDEVLAVSSRMTDSLLPCLQCSRAHDQAPWGYIRPRIPR